MTLDVTHEYYDKSLKFMVYGNVLRNNVYPISVSSERIFQGMAIARYAKEIGADAIAHGSTGAGNDQVRFDMTFLVMCPDMEIITLTRDGNLSRKEEVDYLNQHGFKADFTKLKYSYNVGIWGTSICGGEILDSAQGLPESAYLKQVTKQGTEQLKLTFEKGELKAINGTRYDDPIEAITKVEEIGAAYGIGRDMHVGDTIIGIKGRVGFEAAAPALIIGAHRFLEKYTLSKWQQYWKDQVANWYGMFLHESQYLEPVMRDIEAMLTSSQRNVMVRLFSNCVRLASAQWVWTAPTTWLRLSLANMAKHRRAGRLRTPRALSRCSAHRSECTTLTTPTGNNKRLNASLHDTNWYYWRGRLHGRRAVPHTAQPPGSRNRVCQQREQCRQLAGRGARGAVWRNGYAIYRPVAF